VKEQAYFAAIPVKVLQDKTLYFSYRILFGQIASFANTSGCCWATNETLGKEIGLSESSATRGVRELAVRGFLKVYIDKETGNKRRIYPQQSADLPDEDRKLYKLLYQGEKPTVSTDADRGSAPTLDALSTQSDIIDINEEDKKECTVGSQVSILNESEAPQVNAKFLEDDAPPRLSLETKLSPQCVPDTQSHEVLPGKDKEGYISAVMQMLRKYAPAYWARPDIGTFTDECWKRKSKFDLPQKHWRKKEVPGLIAFLKTHFEEGYAERATKSESITADHSEVDRIVNAFLDECMDDHKSDHSTYREFIGKVAWNRDVRALDFEALKRLYLDNKWPEVTFVREVYKRWRPQMYEQMGIEWSKFAATRKATMEIAMEGYNYYKSWVIPGWPKQQS